MIFAEFGISTDQGIAVTLLVGAFSWLAKYMFLPWRNNVIKRDKNLAIDNKHLIEQRLLDMERQGKERQQIIDHIGTNTTALERIGDALINIKEKCIEPEKSEEK